MTRVQEIRYRARIVRAAKAIEQHLHKAEFYQSLGMYSAADYQRVCVQVEAECAMRASRRLCGMPQS